MKIQLLSTSHGMKSSSLKRLALALSQMVGYRVWRTTKVRPFRKQLKYGDAVDKLTQYRWFEQQGLSSLQYTTNEHIAGAWWRNSVVFGRKLLNASCGNGIVVFDDTTQAPSGCLVYTLYKKKKREFRVHVFKDKVVAIVEKRKRADWNGKSNHKIRNLANGYVFCQDVELTEELRTRVQQLALDASKVSKSDFKGVDLGYNEKQDDLFVIEVNSMPGIEGSNVNKYVEAIIQYV